MARNRRTTTQRIADKKKLSELVKEGKTQQEIADELKISRQQVSEDLKEVKTLWVEEAKNVLMSHVKTAANVIIEILESDMDKEDVPAASIRLAASKALLNRVGLPEITKNEITGDESKPIYVKIIRGASMDEL